MPLEIEAKFRVDHHGPVRERLVSLGAKHLSTVLEINRIFDRPDGWLRERGCGLRVRSAVREDGLAIPSTMTVKGPRQPGRLKIREELEVEVSDADTACDALAMLGHVPILAYEKRRETWRYQECLIELDTPPFIGNFVEIEGPSGEVVGEVQALLELSDAEAVTRSYVALLMAYRDKMGLGDGMLRLV